MITDASNMVDAFTSPRQDSTEYVAGMADMGSTPEEIARTIEDELERANVATDVAREDLVSEIENRIERFEERR